MTLQLRLVATPEHLPLMTHQLLEGLDEGIFGDTFPKVGSYWWLLRDERKEGWGFCGLQPLTGEFKGTGFLCRAGLLHEVRGKGLQQRMITARIKKAREIGLRRLVSYTNVTNFSSAASLLKAGFRFYQPAQPWGGEGMLYFELSL